jgi:hypothetical protein
MGRESFVRWFTDGATHRNRLWIVRVQSRPHPPRIHVLTQADGWRIDVQLRLHRMASGSGWLVTEDEARAIAASWGYELLDPWDDSVPALDDPQSG